MILSGSRANRDSANAEEGEGRRDGVRRSKWGRSRDRIEGVSPSSCAHQHHIISFIVHKEEDGWGTNVPTTTTTATATSPNAGTVMFQQDHIAFPTDLAFNLDDAEWRLAVPPGLAPVHRCPFR
jgi:hypothetical protein